ncbi:glycoside hydrolase family 88 protein [Flavobacterium sp. ANB]|uniref:glycoside hydrolase family 88/105 protein n=1 Tax=unclassified Flavobacterium TaxID=196869 RepID=UPI0012B88349|nr:MULTISPECIES: glycoside hydrolase family 88 protein [unclassified Flavobacterium]MBF4516719.1 glycoside hydrolase family 88 protein [Flavobacterium sp. ANB]MTD69385.1 glycosyl hydrolase family 88 [Flavobacterium sp. LC2016-13]
MFKSTFIKINFINYAIVLLLIFSSKTIAQSKENGLSANSKWSEKAAVTILNKYPKAWQIDGTEKPKWDYKMSLVLFSFEKLYEKTKDKKYLNYIKEYADEMIDSSGNIKKYEIKEYNIDYVNPGKLLFNLYEETKDNRYLKVTQQLRNQLESQPRTTSGGFWHKQIYPNQMWIDGLYMAEPFYAQYTVKYENGKALDDIAKQFELVQNHLVDKKTGLVYQAWDESKQIGWANPETGTSPTIWGRGIGWYMMALVETLDYFPKSHPKQKELVTFLNEISKNIIKYKSTSGLWYQVTDKPEMKDNFVESSSSAMIIYSLAKGTDKGYLPASYKKTAQKSFDAFIKEFVKTEANNEIIISNVSSNVGLGGKPFRDGSNEYYIKSKTKDNSSPALAAFILSAAELGK